MNAPRFCQYCGNAMEPDWQFCEHCGGQPAVPESSPPPDNDATVFRPPVVVPPAPAPRPAPVATPAPRSAPIYAQPVQSVQAASKSPKKWLLPVGIGCIVLTCLCVCAGAGFLLISNLNTGSESMPPTPISEIAPAPTNAPLQPSDTPQAPLSPDPTEAPAPTADIPPTPWPTAEDQLTGNQSRSDTAIFDDFFSSKALGWSEYDDGTTIIQYENETYSFQVIEAEYYDWAYAPVDFWPNAIQFDVWGLPGTQKGTFGVMCQYQDADNYYYVEIDLSTREFVMSVNRAGEHTPLTFPDQNGQYWLIADPLTVSPDEANRIDLLCYQDYMVLVINEALVWHADIPDPFPNPGDIALFVYAYPYAGPQGYKVYFDNVGVQHSEE
ncbi:MAG TPA: hypothetical protein DEH25_06675 [Chloroflexi bacterium]|nr:hypothetical protein [Chloroflexota bacterium]